MTLVREHRGGLDESMATVKDIASKAELCALINEGMASWGRHVWPESILIEKYYYDERIGWDTHLIIINDYGVWGMSDGDLP